MDHIFREVHDGENTFYISIEFDDSEFVINILKNATAWTAKKSVEELQTESLLSNKDEYYEKLKGFLKNPNNNIEFKVNSKNVFIVLLNSKIKFFKCNLKEVEYSQCAVRLIHKFYTERNIFSERLESITIEKNNLEIAVRNLENKLKQLVQAKISVENDLYNSFVMVLNEKKTRIQHLNELIESFRRGRPTVNPHVEVKTKVKKVNAKKKQAEIKNEISSSDSEENYNTDEDIANIKQESEDIPTVTKHSYDFLSDDSLEEYSLPKRMKPASTSSNTIIIPSTSKCGVRNERSNSKITDKDEPKSPTIDLDTQELLNCI